jgi:hypothetical protein
MVGTMNHSAGHGIEGRLEGRMISAHIIFPFSITFTKVTWPVDLLSPHHNQLCSGNLIGPHKLSYHPITTDALVGLLVS